MPLARGQKEDAHESVQLMRVLSASCYASSLFLDSFVSKRFLFVFFGMLVG